MQSQRTLSQWIAIAAVVPVVVFTFGHVHGQAQNQGSTGAQATFQGRPAMAGAQAGTGAMAGPPQGGVAPQSTDQPGGGLVLRAPESIRNRDVTPKQPDQDMPRQGEQAVPRDPGVDVPKDGELSPRRDRDDGEVIKRDRDSAGTDQSTGKKVRKSARRTLEHSRRGVPSVQ